MSPSFKPTRRPSHQPSAQPSAAPTRSPDTWAKPPLSPQQQAAAIGGSVAAIFGALAVAGVVWAVRHHRKEAAAEQEAIMERYAVVRAEDLPQSRDAVDPPI